MRQLFFSVIVLNALGACGSDGQLVAGTTLMGAALGAPGGPIGVAVGAAVGAGAGAVIPEEAFVASPSAPDR
jgi:hypothetical protein